MMVLFYCCKLIQCMITDEVTDFSVILQWGKRTISHSASSAEFMELFNLVKGAPPGASSLN